MSKRYTQAELASIIEKHRKWLRGEAGGERADLSRANLSEADLSYANLGNANLSYADLSHADLSRANLSYASLGYANLGCANLSRASLSHANLSRANLSYASLSGADLSGASLSEANLSEANLSGANLSYASLSGANLSYASLYVDAAEGVKGIVLLVMHLTKHRLVYRGDTGEVQIGCEKHSLAHWLEKYRSIGKANGYNKEDVTMYGAALRLIDKRYNK